MSLWIFILCLSSSLVFKVLLFIFISSLCKFYIYGLHIKSTASSRKFFFFKRTFCEKGGTAPGILPLFIWFCHWQYSQFFSCIDRIALTHTEVTIEQYIQSPWLHLKQVRHGLMCDLLRQTDFNLLFFLIAKKHVPFRYVMVVNIRRGFKKVKS